ncbi:hypothetical protein [Arsenophonus apicola]|uniref:Uncharacterized protein n=1 Tax=Arsenophonus apicola TaxID=2879119 RepID=A0ABY8P5J6_9GAMM|nr:hypothetical protein [Arsenophonus apicola]WGO84778.1 hypothetical protein QG404_07935 [Arsenophonus apicola]
MFRQVIDNHSHSNIAAIQISEVDNITISSSHLMDSQLAQQIRHVSNNHIDWQSAMMNSEAESSASAAQLTSADRLTVSMQCINIRSEDEQRVPNMTLNMTVGVDANISLYSPPETFLDLGRNIANYNASSFSESNDELPELESASREQFQDLSQYINQLERERAAQSVAEVELPALDTEENSTNFTLNVEDADRELLQREQQDFYDANIANVRAAEARAAEARPVEHEEVITNRDPAPVDNEVEMVGSDVFGWEESFIPIEEAPNGRQPSSATGLSERLNQNSTENISSVRMPIEDHDPSIN